MAASATNEDDIQIKWDCTKKDVDSDQWDQMFFELSQFKVINGHTNVEPWPSEPRACELSDWCNIQRQNYANLWSDRYSPMTEHQIRQLNQVSEINCNERRCVYRMCLAHGELFFNQLFTQLRTYARERSSALIGNFPVAMRATPKMIVKNGSQSSKFYGSIMWQMDTPMCPGITKYLERGLMLKELL